MTNCYYWFRGTILPLTLLERLSHEGWVPAQIAATTGA